MCSQKWYNAVMKLDNIPRLHARTGHSTLLINLRTMTITNDFIGCTTETLPTNVSPADLPNSFSDFILICMKRLQTFSKHLTCTFCPLMVGFMLKKAILAITKCSNVQPMEVVKPAPLF